MEPKPNLLISSATVALEMSEKLGLAISSARERIKKLLRFVLLPNFVAEKRRITQCPPFHVLKKPASELATLATHISLGA